MQNECELRVRISKEERQDFPYHNNIDYCYLTLSLYWNDDECAGHLLMQCIFDFEREKTSIFRVNLNVAFSGIIQLGGLN